MIVALFSANSVAWIAEISATIMAGHIRSTIS
jgi:hypothetical protein